MAVTILSPLICLTISPDGFEVALPNGSKPVSNTFVMR